MKNIIISVILFVLISLTVVDAFLWHHNTDKNVACTVVFKPEPSVSRTGYPHYYVEVRRNDNNEWQEFSVSGELHASLGRGDQVRFAFDNDITMIIHSLIIVLGLLGCIGFFVDGYTEIHEPRDQQMPK